jgi:hypothetical protein
MFEDKKWSGALKKVASEFLTRHHLEDLSETIASLADVIEMAIEEGFQEAQDTVDDWHDDSRREPQRDESRD